MELALALVGLVLFAAAVAVGARSAMRDRRERIEMAAGDAERQQFCARLRTVVTHDEPLTEEAAVALREQLRVDLARDPHTVLEVAPARIEPLPEHRALLEEALPVLEAIGRVTIADAERDRASLRLSAYGNAKSRGSVRVGDVRRARRLADRIREALR